MKSVAKISAELADQLSGTKVDGGIRFFNPVQDADGYWVISLLEAQYLEPDQFEVITNNPIV